MASQVEKIISWAKSKVGSSAWNGMCQKFVRQAYEAAGIYGSAPTATDAYRKWCVSSSKKDIPTGAAVYFNGTDPAVGHVALYIGGGQCVNPAKTVYICALSSIPNYRGWGWQGGQKPNGAAVSSGAVSGDDDDKSKSETKSKTPKKEKKNITKTAVKSINGTSGVYKYTHLHDYVTADEAYYDLTIENDRIYRPIVTGDISLTRERTNAPSSIKFSVLKDDGLNFREGNPVRFVVGGENIFYGYIFSKSRKDNTTIDVTAYDQLRYFKNKDSYIYENKKYSELLKMIAEDYLLKLGSIADTGYVIPQRVEDGTLFDILGNASDITTIRTGKIFVLYDDFGEITLKNVTDMQTDIFIDETQLKGFDYKTSIDKDVYNRVKLAKDNDETGEREFYVFNDAKNQAEWGLLQYYDKLDDNSGDINLRGQMLLRHYNVKSRSLKLSGVFGSTAVRGGSSVLVNLDIGDMVLSNRMLVEKAVHKFSGGHHFMDLTVSGIRGEFQ